MGERKRLSAGNIYTLFLEPHIGCYITFTLRRRIKYKALTIIPSNGIKTNKAPMAYPWQSD